MTMGTTTIAERMTAWLLQVAVRPAQVDANQWMD